MPLHPDGRRPLGSALLTLVALAGFSLPAQAVEIEPRGDKLVISGRVEPDDFVKMREAVEANPETKTIVLRNSPGDKLKQAMLMAEFIRERSLNTAVSGHCRSACGIMFLAGVERRSTNEFPPTQTYVAFHGGYDREGQNTGRFDTRVSAAVRRFTDGRLDPGLVEQWLALPKRGMVYFFDPAHYRSASQANVFLCRGDEAKRVRDCERRPEIDPYQAGVFTSREAVSVN